MSAWAKRSRSGSWWWSRQGANASEAKRKPRPIRILEPGALTFDYRGGLLVADRKLHRVVRIDLRSGKRRVAVTGLRDIVGLGYDDLLRLYVAAGDRIYRVAGGRKTVIAGNGQRGHTGDGGPATAASFGGIGGFEVDHDKSIVVAEYDNWIRFIDPNGFVSTIAGNGDEGYAGDGGPARASCAPSPARPRAARRPRSDRRRLAQRSAAANRSRGDDHDARYWVPVAGRGQGRPGQLALRRGRRAERRLPALCRRAEQAAHRPRNGPFNLAVDDRDNVYVSEIAGARRVLRVAPSGRVRVLVR